MKILENPIAESIWVGMVRHFPQLCCKMLYHKAMGKKLNLKNPKDLNEKIHWLKFHTDQMIWAQLSDKYAVREYVKSRGLEHLLVKLYGKYDTPEELIADWGNLPEQFVLKSNNGCGTVKIVKNKSLLSLEAIKGEMQNWLKQRKVGLSTVELHYTLITPCLIVEELLEDPMVSKFSRSLIDYKIWCFNGKPFCCAAIYDRSAHYAQFDLYDLDWQPMRNHVTHVESRNYQQVLCKPKHWDKMLEYASILTKGHPEVRMDMYNVDGRIYFGEMTFTAKGGFQDDYSQEILLRMGEQIVTSSGEISK